jgi:hypothetical protein
MVTGLLGLSNLGCELGLQRVDHGPEAFGIYPPFAASLKLADRYL